MEYDLRFSKESRADRIRACRETDYFAGYLMFSHQDFRLLRFVAL